MLKIATRKGMMQEKLNAENRRAPLLESNQHSQEKSDDGRNERATRDGRGAQRGTVRRRVEPREVFCSVSKSFAFECYVTSTSAYLLQQKKLNNRDRISHQSEKYIARKWYNMTRTTISRITTKKTDDKDDDYDDDDGHEDLRDIHGERDIWAF